MTDSKRRRVLAFDSSCGSCRQISATVASSCDGRLEVLPLKHPDVVRWRREGLGPDPAWAPTLLWVGDDEVRAWTGRSMALPMIRSLGLVTTLRVLRALGRLREEERYGGADDGVAGGLPRKRFLRLGFGVALAGGLVLTGRIPAYAGADPARRWVEANRDRLPRRYEDVVAYPLDYRRAIFQELTPAQRSDLWIEQLHRYSTAHPALTPEQRSVIATALSIAADRSSFAGAGLGQERSRRFQRSAEDAFGPAESRLLFATLGPDPRSALTPADQRGCTCATNSDWCDNSTHCFRTSCVNNSGCGTLWTSNCDGLCRN